MILKKCEKMHYYDGEKYAKCPHCGGFSYKLPKDILDERSADDQLADFEKKDISENKISNTKEQRNLTRVLSESVQKLDTKCDSEINAEVEESQVIVEESKKKDSVVGWLVCIKGANSGEAYQLKNGENSIGGTTGKNICIDGDCNITDAHNIAVFYEKESRQFFIYNKNMEETVYYNGQILCECSYLSMYDLIYIGNTLLMFVPLCSRYFSWVNNEGVIDYGESFTDS